MSKVDDAELNCLQLQALSWVIYKLKRNKAALDLGYFWPWVIQCQWKEGKTHKKHSQIIFPFMSVCYVS